MYLFPIISYFFFKMIMFYLKLLFSLFQNLLWFSKYLFWREIYLAHLKYNIKIIFHNDSKASKMSFILGITTEKRDNRFFYTKLILWSWKTASFLFLHCSKLNRSQKINAFWTTSHITYFLNDKPVSRCIRLQWFVKHNLFKKRYWNVHAKIFSGVFSINTFHVLKKNNNWTVCVESSTFPFCLHIIQYLAF